MQVEVFSDVVCPWCFIGKRRLEAGLAQRPDMVFDVHWRPFELNPDLPRAGVDRDRHLSEKFGGRDTLAAMQRRLADLGLEAGIAFRFDLIAKVPNTRAAHRVIAAAGPASSSMVKERLLRAYFEQGVDIGDPAALTSLAVECGLDARQIDSLLTREDGFDEIARAEEEGLRLGVSGVPTFVFERRYMLSGAQPVDVILQVIDHLTVAQPVPPRFLAQG